MNLRQSAVLRAICEGRGLILGSKPEERSCSVGMVAQAKAWGLVRGERQKVGGRDPSSLERWLKHPPSNA